METAPVFSSTSLIFILLSVVLFFVFFISSFLSAVVCRAHGGSRSSRKWRQCGIATAFSRWNGRVDGRRRLIAVHVCSHYIKQMMLTCRCSAGNNSPHRLYQYQYRIFVSYSRAARNLVKNLNRMHGVILDCSGVGSDRLVSFRTGWTSLPQCPLPHCLTARLAGRLWGRSVWLPRSWRSYVRTAHGHYSIFIAWIEIFITGTVDLAHTMDCAIYLHIEMQVNCGLPYSATCSRIFRLVKYSENPKPVYNRSKINYWASVAFHQLWINFLIYDIPGF